jgi:hypothetical protein
MRGFLFTGCVRIWLNQASQVKCFHEFFLCLANDPNLPRVNPLCFHSHRPGHTAGELSFANTPGPLAVKLASYINNDARP